MLPEAAAAAAAVAANCVQAVAIIVAAVVAEWFDQLVAESVVVESFEVNELGDTEEQYRPLPLPPLPPTTTLPLSRPLLPVSAVPSNGGDDDKEVVLLVDVSGAKALAREKGC